MQVELEFAIAEFDGDDAATAELLDAVEQELGQRVHQGALDDVEQTTSAVLGAREADEVGVYGVREA